MNPLLWMAMGGGGGPSDAEAPTLAWTIAANGLSADGVSPESLDDSVTLNGADFVFSGPGGTAPSISSVSYQTTTNADDTVRVVFATPWYAPEGTGITVDIAAGAVEDLAGNQLAAVTGGAVTNGSTVWPVDGAWSAEDVETSGASVTQANDLTGSGKHIAFPDSPTLDLATYGNPVLDFNGTSNYGLFHVDTASALTGSEDQPMAFGAVIRYETVARFILEIGASVVDYFARILQTGGNIQLRRRGGAGDKTASSTGAALTISTWHSCTVLCSGVAAAFEINESDVTGASDIDVSATTSTTVGYLCRGSGGTYHDGQLGRWFLHSANLAGRDKSVMSTWLQTYSDGM